MFLRILHRFRLPILICIGVAIALAVASGIFLSLKNDTKISQLSDRIDRTQALAYISTPDKQTILSALQTYEEILGSRIPMETEIPDADHFTLALLRTGSGTAWIIETYREAEEANAIVASENVPSLLLPRAERRRSLSFSPLFRYVGSPRPSFAWYDLTHIPLPDSGGAEDIARAILSPYTEGIILYDSPDHGRLILQGEAASIYGNAAEVRMSDVPGLAVSVGNGETALRSFSSALGKHNPALLEGITGILKARLEEWTGSSDLEGFVSDMLSGPVNITLQTGEDEDMLFALSGTLRHEKNIALWMERIALVRMKGSVRHMEFFEKEYSRTDVIAAEENSMMDAGTFGDWSKKIIGGSGAKLSLFLALSGRRYQLSNDENVMQKAIETGMAGGGMGTGTADIAWFSQLAEEHMPFLMPLRPTLVSLFGEPLGRITWKIAPIMNGISIDWSRKT